MKWFKRITLFVLVNFLIMVTISILLNVLGVQPYLTESGINYEQLALFCLIWGMGGAFISLGLSRILAKFMMGVKLVDENTRSDEARWLLQTVHGQAKQVGIETMPQVGIYESPDLNAFATGPTRNRALVAVSSGLLQKMNRQQAEAVLAHEISHVANGDMVTMTLLQGVVNAFVMFIARVIAIFASQGVKEDARPMVRFMVTMALDIILGLLGAMVVAKFSRYREFRADAGGAKLAGAHNMASALRVLGQSYGLLGADPRGNESIAAFKISGKSGGFLALLSTHPPLEERIRRLEHAQY